MPINGSGSIILCQEYMQDNVFFNNTGVPMYIIHSNKLWAVYWLRAMQQKLVGEFIWCYFFDKCEVTLINNSATVNGGGIYEINFRIKPVAKGGSGVLKNPPLAFEKRSTFSVKGLLFQERIYFSVKGPLHFTFYQKGPLLWSNFSPKGPLFHQKGPPVL